jgi:hypothetical protein
MRVIIPYNVMQADAFKMENEVASVLPCDDEDLETTLAVWLNLYLSQALQFV